MTRSGKWERKREHAIHMLANMGRNGMSEDSIRQNLKVPDTRWAKWMKDPLFNKALAEKVRDNDTYMEALVSAAGNLTVQELIKRLQDAKELAKVPTRDLLGFLEAIKTKGPNVQVGILNKPGSPGEITSDLQEFLRQFRVRGPDGDSHNRLLPGDDGEPQARPEPVDDPSSRE